VLVGRAVVVGTAGMQSERVNIPLMFPERPTMRQFFSQAATPGDCW
jgi:hypothetical protein